MTLKTDDDRERHAGPVVTLHFGADNVEGAPWRSGSTNGGSIQYIGMYSTTEQCQRACLALCDTRLASVTKTS